jgi:endothelin-converting enzyme
MAYNAYQLSLIGKSNPPSMMLNDITITANQLFYYSFAERSRDDDDNGVEYSTYMIRVNGVLRNQPGFYEAFNVKADNQFNKSTGKGMYLPEKQRVKVW